MDPATDYARLLKSILQEHESFGRQVGNQPIYTHFIYDDAHQEYLMINIGWNTVWNQSVYGVMFHGWIDGGRIRIAHDLASPSVTSELIERGVPKEHVLFLSEHEPDAERVAVPAH